MEQETPVIAELVEFKNKHAKWRAVKWKCTCGATFYLSSAGPMFTEDQIKQVNVAAGVIDSLLAGNTCGTKCGQCGKMVTARLNQSRIVLAQSGVLANRHERRAALSVLK